MKTKLTFLVEIAGPFLELAKLLFHLNVVSLDVAL